MLEKNLHVWCITCSNPGNKKRCERTPEELAQIGLEVGVFKADFVDQPFEEDHPRFSKRKSQLSIGTNVQTNREETQSTTDANDADYIAKTPGVSIACTVYRVAIFRCWLVFIILQIFRVIQF